MKVGLNIFMHKLNNYVFRFLHYICLYVINMITSNIIHY